MANGTLLKMRKYIVYEYICPQCDEGTLTVNIPILKEPLKMYEINEIQEQIKQGTYESPKFESYTFQCRECGYSEEYINPIKPNGDKGNELSTITVKAGIESEMTDEEKIKAFDNIINNVK